ncbi:glycosyltransferase family 9 protein [Mucilaginibacter sp. BJC16-A38]|uniref:glycosyltransferase family 9 protein n=1 Tax=Mucilaginibacter phenanthrenivorans TaxID=1234842 RepID=UPI00215866F4|nr:glycosyltransferase family 9 protein [Mucilaginibacter phenanthrenivorans]MCR8559749.1 glycosyltransferase family 9 protein [Mucilaginibacter phenanthrenivorans]
MKILIRLPNWLGDVVMSTAFVAAVREFYPDATIDVVIKTELSGIAALIPGLNAVHPFAKQENKGLAGVFRFGKGFRNEKYDLFFNLPTSLSSLVMAWATGAKKRVGFGKEGAFFLLTDCYRQPLRLHRTDEYIFLLEQFTGKAINSRLVKLNAGNLSAPNNNRLIINFNSEAESRRMPVDKAKSIINTLTRTFTGTTFTFIGSPKEEAFVNDITKGVENYDRIENLAGKTNLAGLAGLMANSAAVLTTDSGPAHLANSVGTPTVVLFGAGNEQNTAPYNKQNLTVLRYGKLNCEPCVKNTCKLYGIPKCLELLDELQIINALSVYLHHA